MAFSYSFALKNLFPEVLYASAARVSTTGAGAGEGAFFTGGLVGVRWGGGLGASFSPSGGAVPFEFPFSFVGAEELAGEEVEVLVGEDGELTESLSMSMGAVGWSAITDIFESRRSSSGGRLSGWESRSYFWREDLEKGFVGEGFLERVPEVVVVVDFELGRFSRSLSRERDEVEGFFSGEAGGVGRGEEGRGGIGLLLSFCSVVFFADLKRFIWMMGWYTKRLATRQGIPSGRMPVSIKACKSATPFVQSVCLRVYLSS